MSDEAPIELYGFHPEDDLILARRASEPAFVWVQDLEDAYQAAGVRGAIDIVVSEQFKAELVARGYSPVELQGLRVI